MNSDQKAFADLGDFLRANGNHPSLLRFIEDREGRPGAQPVAVKRPRLVNTGLKLAVVALALDAATSIGVAAWHPSILNCAGAASGAAVNALMIWAICKVYRA